VFCAEIRTISGGAAGKARCGGGSCGDTEV